MHAETDPMPQGVLGQSRRPRPRLGGPKVAASPVGEQIGWRGRTMVDAGDHGVNVGPGTIERR